MFGNNTRIPESLLQKLYTWGSLQKRDNGFQFKIKNRLVDITLNKILHLKIDDEAVDLANVILRFDDGRKVAATDISAENQVSFNLAKSLQLRVADTPIEFGKHHINLGFEVDMIGVQAFGFEDEVVPEDKAHPQRKSVPRDAADDYTPEIIGSRQKFVEEFSGKKLEHIPHYSVEPSTLQGNIENFTGVAQIPIGIAGPIKINGEHAQGEYLVPLATTEGTLVASYNRGIKVVNLSGGVRCTVVDDSMQRAPVFVFDHARAARDFLTWIDDNFDQIKAEAETTSSVAKLKYIDPYLASRYAYLRFNYTTGDAAGQNMVGRATFAACNWILDAYEGEPIRHYYLESNFATDKKASQVNILRTRGKRVTAECEIKRDVLLRVMRVEPESLHYHSNIATVGAFLSGANNNGAHSPNAITAMFIATGQDVANVAESSAAVTTTEMLDNGNLYLSITIPSLIVATYGGGTGLATQREALEIMDCYGRDRVKKLAEIIAGVVLAGEISLGSAISSSDWVKSHEKYGRNR